tara:strand:+ start:116 stop:586 length:471 start_codon:yes stop_codon:yes gene_type:complete
MSNKKLITDELINERLENIDFGEKQANDQDLAINSVLKHYNIEFVDNYNRDSDFYLYEETTGDGYSVYVATHDMNTVCISESVYQYEQGLSEPLYDFITNCNGCGEFPSKISVDDLCADYIDGVIEQLFEELAFRYEEEIIEDLLIEGYEKIKINQ